MGIIREKFKTFKYENEEDVKLKFIIPFFKKFLGYSERNIRPESSYTSLEFPLNRSITRVVTELESKGGRPDYIIEDDEGSKLFLVEAKGPKENLLHYEHQLQAYCTGTKTNLIIITNGIQFAIYDVNVQFLFCNNLFELDKNFNKIALLLHKFHSSKDFKTRIFDFLKELDLPTGIPDLLSNFKNFFERKSKLQEYIECLGEKLPRIVDYQIFEFRDNNKNLLNFEEIIEDIENDRIDCIILRGDSGVGKSQFLKYLESHFSERSLKGLYKTIPLFIDLNLWSLRRSLFDVIFESIKNTTIIDESFFRFLLKQDMFLFLLDSYNELPQKDKIDFLKDFQNFQNSFPNARTIITMKRDTYFREFLEYKISKTIYMGVFKIEQFKESYDSLRLQFSFDTFLQKINDYKLGDLVSMPLFLNYLLIYIKNKNKFPQSKAEIISTLIQYYFEDFLSNKFYNVDKLKNLKVWEVLLKKLSYFMHYNLNVNQIKDAEIKQFLIEQIDLLKIDHTKDITIERIIEFFEINNILVEQEGYFKFWHQILFDFYGGCELADQVNSKSISDDEIEKIIKMNSMREVIINSFSFIEREEFLLSIKKIDFFLFIEGMIERNDISYETVNQIVQFLVLKLNSDYNYIVNLALPLLKRIIFYVENLEDFLINLIKKEIKRSISKWALLELGKLKSEKAKSYLLSYEGHFLLETAKYVALCNFDEEEIHIQILDRISNYWYGNFQLMEICHGIRTIEERKKLTSKSFNKIIELFFNSPEKIRFASAPEKFVEKNMFHYHLIRHLSVIISERKDHSIYQKLIDEIDYENLNYISTSNLSSELMTEEDLQKILSTLENDEISYNQKIPLLFILKNIPIKLDFDKIVSFLKALPSNFEDRMVDSFYSHIIELFNDPYKFTKFNREKILRILPQYIELGPRIQRSIVEVIGKYSPKYIFKKNLPKKLYFDTYKTILELISRNNYRELQDFLIEEAKKCIPNWMHGRTQAFHNQFLFSD
ncbi:MAG: NACHT domain-containing protein, partial [Promethearchaeota archaeon]